MQRKVEDWMTRGPVTVREDTPLGECAQKFLDFQARHLPVVNEDGAVVGLVIDYDLFARGSIVDDDGEARWMAVEPEFAQAPASTVMSDVSLTAKRSDRLDLLLNRMLMSDDQDLALVIDDADEPIGILTEHDGVRIACEVLPFGTRVEANASAGPITADRNHPAKLARQRMEDHRIRHMLVTDRDAKLVGVLSYRDLITNPAVNDDHFHAGDATGPETYTVPQGASAREAAELMLSKHIGCVPIVDPKGHAVGLITRRDLIQAAIDHL